MVLASNRYIANLLSWSFVALLAACATDSNSKKQSFEEGKQAEEGGKEEESSGAGEKVAESEETEVQVSASFSTFVFSNTNNPLALHSVNKEKAQDMIKDLDGALKKPSFKDRKELIALLSVKAVAGFGIDNMLDTAQQLVNVEMSKDIKRDLPETAKIQLILSAIRTRNFAMAEHFINMLSDSKSKKVKALVSFSEGFIAYLEERIPEAVYYWNEALKSQPDYAPARLNLAFIALRYGDAATAKRMLGDMDDTLATSGRIAAARLTGNSDEVSSLCSKVSDKEYKPAMLSCALNLYESEKKYEEAIKALQELVKAKPTAPTLDEKAYKVIGRIEEEKKKAKDREAEERAKKALEKVDKQHGKPEEGAGGAPEGGAAPQQGGDQPPAAGQESGGGQ